ncbi:ferrous iron transporter B [Actinotalea sp. M2MS4P-6]|uniref:ferrous iron transporter B n=1 Tax=Actinotalea sp. M2MS4P-6 TaxID=2983762 RepID=UPI0021E4C010|nr:ferrous iron transporter B [Actinotalea sp. M2MS4P-6]MCV2396302.1 ferrous iron transporter B [Actinotalea sp. M2MS4P-6]
MSSATTRLAAVLLVGNPNAGKSTLFSRMTGTRARVVNAPGTTVEMQRGVWRRPGMVRDVLDLPGTYSLIARSPDEDVVVDALADRDAIAVVVLDAAALSRSLYLLAQVARTGRPVVVAVTMLDVAREHGTAVDLDVMADLLGVPVVGVDPRTGAGLAELAEALPGAGHVRGVAASDVSGDGELTARLAEAQELFGWVEQIGASLLPQPTPRVTRTDRVDRVLLNPWIGLPVFLLVLWALFELTTSVAGPVIDLVSRVVTGPVATVAASWLGGFTPDWVVGLLVDGVLVGLGVVATFLPVMAITYLALAVIEDSGYLARAAYLADHAMRVVGLDGRAILPLVLGFGCNVPALAATRTLPGIKHRLFTALLVPWTSCTARLTVYVVLAEVVLPQHAGLVVFGMYVLSVALVLVGGAALRLTTFREMRAEPLVLVLPPYQRPRLRPMLATVWARVWAFATGAGKVVVAALVIVWALLAIPAPGHQGGDSPQDSLYGWAAESVAPVFGPAGFDDWHVVSALAGGFVAKEVVVGQLAQSYAVDAQAEPRGLVSAIESTLDATSGGHPQAAGLALMVFVLGYTPCVATIAEQRRILGTRWTVVAVGVQLVAAWTLAVVVFQLGRLVP